MKTIKKILMSTDFSELSSAAVEYTKSLTARYKAKLFVIHVIDDLPALPMHTTDLTSERVVADAQVRAKKELKTLIASQLKGLKGVTQVVRIGEPDKEIVGFANKQKVDLIVLSTHGRTGLAHALLGSVAEKVVRHSTVPVLTIKPANMQ